MPELDLSGDIVAADADVGFDEGVVAGRIGPGGRLTVDVGVDLCHGLSGSLSAEAVVGVQAELRLLWAFLGEGQGEGLAAAGATAAAHLSGDLFDTFGLRAEAAAYAEASLAGRVALGLDIQEVARHARDRLDGPAYDIFVAFLNEAELTLGVWGKVGVSAMAQAHLNIRGSLRDDRDAGFVVEHGADVGWGAGGGYEFYGGIGLESPKRFFCYASDRVARELALAAREHLPAELHPATAVLGFVLPVALNAAYELGQTAALDGLAPDRLTSTFTDTVVAQLQRFCLDAMGELGGRLVAGYLADGLALLLARDLSGRERAEVRTSAADLAVFLRTRVDARELTLADITRVTSEIADLLAVMLPAETIQWRRAIAITWLAVAAAEALRAGLTSFTAAWSGSVIGGISDGAGDAVLVLPTPPDLVSAELSAFFGAPTPRLELGHAVDYLIGQGPGPMLGAALPDLASFFDALAGAVGLTPGDVIASALQGALTADLSQTELYRALRDVVRGQVEDVVLRDLVPPLRDHARDTDDRVLLRWLDEVAEPGLLLLSGFVFERLDVAAAGALTGDLSPFTATFRTALSVLVGRLVTLNVIVLAEIALEAVIDQLHGGLRELARTVRADPSHAVALAAPAFVRTLLPMAPPAAGTAARELVADLLNAAAEGFGPTVWTARRKEDLLGTVRALLDSVDGHPDFADRPALEQFLAEVAECQYIPNGDRLVHLLVLQAEILGAAVDTALPATLEALRRFALRVTIGVLDALEDDLRAFLDDLEADLTRLWNALQDARRWLTEQVAALQAAVRAAAASLEAAADMLRASAQRQQALDRLLTVGLARNRKAVRALPGFDLQPADWQEHELGAAAALFTSAFDTARPVFDAALATLAPLADGLGDLVDAAADLPDLVHRLGDEAEQMIVDAANDALGRFGLALPKELSVGDIVDAFRWVLDHLSAVRDALQAALSAADAEATARTRRDAARVARDQAREAHAAADERLAAATPPVRVRIVSPLPVGPAPGFTYGREVPVVIELDGATSAFQAAADGRRAQRSTDQRPPPPVAEDVRIGPAAGHGPLDDRNVPARRGQRGGVQRRHRRRRRPRATGQRGVPGQPPRDSAARSSDRRGPQRVRRVVAAAVGEGRHREPRRGGGGPLGLAADGPRKPGLRVPPVSAGRRPVGHRAHRRGAEHGRRPLPGAAQAGVARHRRHRGSHRRTGCPGQVRPVRRGLTCSMS